MKKILATIIALTTLGCGTVRVYSADDRAPALVEQAGEILGVKTVMVKHPKRGVMVLRVENSRYDEEKEKWLCGTAEEKVLSAKSVLDALENGVLDCQPEAWTCPSAEAAAHEIGHVYGLVHTPQETGGMMAPKLNGDTSVTVEQKAIVNSMAHALERACWEK